MSLPLGRGVKEFLKIENNVLVLARRNPVIYYSSIIVVIVSSYEQGRLYPEEEDIWRLKVLKN